MAEAKIEWCDYKWEWNPGGGRVVAAEAYWRLPYRWDRAAKEAGERRKVFCASLADVFEDPPELAEPRMRLFKTIGDTPNLDWLLLTKRPEVAVDNWPLWCGYWLSRRISDAGSVYPTLVMPNVWVGVSVEDQRRADGRIPLLLQIPAAVRFLSVEPLLGPIEVSGYLDEYCPILKAKKHAAATGHGWHGDNCHVHCTHPDCGATFAASAGIDWVIVGGESGPNAMPMHPDWVRSVRDQCVAAGVPFFFKQWGEWCPDSDLWVKDDGHTSITTRRLPKAFPLQTVDGVEMARVGKKAAGRVLDGEAWGQFPEAK